MCKVNKWVINGVQMAIQITFVFAFLTVFFFVYVQEVEKSEFVSQMNLIVDNIMKDIEIDIPELINKQNQISKEDALVIISGVIDTLQEKIQMDATKNIHDIIIKNHAVKMKAFGSLMTVIAVVVIIAIITIISGFCIPIQYQMKEAMLIVVFVGMTELVFLELIAKRYISADPNKVKRELGISIQNWIKTNNKL